MYYFTCVLILTLATIASIAVADPCDDLVCPSEIDPICGRLKHEGHDIYRTFSSECTLQDENCHNPMTLYQYGYKGQTCDQQKLMSTCEHCHDEFVPVCGVLQQGGQKSHVQFGNQCELWKTNCQNPDRPIVALGKDGQKCAELGITNDCFEGFDCGTEYLPVCGLLESEGHKIYETFGNGCLLKNIMCQNKEKPAHFTHPGPVGSSCEQQDLVSECSPSCPELDEPRCGKHELPSGRVMYRTFGNNCLLVQHNCQNPRFSYHTDGEVGTPCPKES